MAADPMTDAEHVALFDRLWGDERRRDDRSEFHECEHCGRAVRWISNSASRVGSSLQIVARPVTTSTWFDTGSHLGLIAVFPNRTGFTVSRAHTSDDLVGAFLYRCHWDVCVDAKRIRDRMHRERYGAPADAGELDAAPDVVRRYAEWRDSKR